MNPDNPLCIIGFRGFATKLSRSHVRIALLSLGTAAVILASPLSAADIRLDLTSGWNGNTGQEFPGAVGGVEMSPEGKQLKIAYDFSNGGQYISASRSLDNTATLSSIKLKAKGPGHLTVSVRDATGQNLIYNVGMTGAEEQTYLVELSKPSRAYGGAGDKVAHHPVKGIRVMASKKQEALKGTLVISEVSLVPAP